MKKNIIIALALLLLSVTAFAGENVNAEKLSVAKDAYKASLKSDNAGVRNSALLQIVVVASNYPEFNARALESDLNRMSKRDDVPYIRVNAKIALDLLNNADWLKSLNTDENDPKVFFNNAYTTMNNMYAVN